MTHIKFPKSYKILVPTVLVAVILTIFMPRTGEFEFHYRKGRTWNYETLVAPFDFPILKTQEQLRQDTDKQKATVIPYYYYSPDVFQELERSAINIDADSVKSFARDYVEHLRPMYEIGVLPENALGKSLSPIQDNSLIYVQKDKHASKLPRSEVYTQTQVRNAVVSYLYDEYPDVFVDSILSKTIFVDLIMPNLVFDKQTTEILHRKEVNEISPTSGVFKAGNVIVATGDIVTSDVVQILDSYKAEFEKSIGYNGPIAFLWLGNFLLALVMTILLFTLVMFSRPGIFQNIGEYYFVLTMFTLSALVSFVLGRFPSEYTYFMPYPVFALYFMAFFRKRLVLSLYTLSLLPLLITSNLGTELYVTFLFAGFTAVYSFSYFNRGWRQFISAFFIFLSMSVVYLGFRLIGGTLSAVVFRDLIFIFVGSMFAVLAYPLIYLFELIFSLVSVDKLKDLADTGNPLLRELANKAPGTFQHSVSVMNMTEFVGRSVDADLPLLRVASLYHDIGKMENPQCYVENQAPGQEFHSAFTPMESASEIIAHVSRGDALAEKHGLPQIVRDFIKSHHGTTTVAYFLDKYIKEGGDAENISAFTYPGPLPCTKEQVILMICDTVEAASRTFKDYLPETISTRVDKLYNDKFNAGQFDLADITMKEMDIIKQNIKNYLLQVHHSRIAYPNSK